MSDTTQTEQPSLDLQTPFTSSLNNFEDAPQAPQLYNINIASDPERAKFRDAFADKNNNGGLTPNVISQAPADENPQEYRDLGMNIKALSLFTGQAPEDIAQNYEYQKQKFIKENNLDMPNNEGQFRSTLGNQFKVADEQATAIDEARQKALQDDMEDADAGMNKSVLSRYQEWNTQHAGSFVGVPESQKMNAFMQAYIPARHAVQSPYGQLAKEIVQNFQNDNPTDDISNKAEGAVRQVQNALGVDMSNPDAESTIRPVTHSSEVADRLADKLAEVPSQDIPKVRALVRAYAKLSNKGEGDSPMAAVTYRLAQQIGRPVSGLLPKIKDTMKLQPLQDYLDLQKSFPEQDQDKNQIAKTERQIRNLKMRSVLRSIANEDVNPIKSNWWGEKALGEVSGAASYVAAFSLGPAAGEAYMMGSSMVDYQDRQIAQNPDIDLKEIEAKVSSVGVMSAAMQLVGMGTVAKAFPATEAAINTLALDRPVLNAVLHGTVSTGAMTGSQFMDLAGDIASTALDKDFGKDRNFSKEALDTLIHTPTTFAVMMLLGGIAHDKLTPEQIQEQIAYLRDPIAARAAGMDKNLFIGKTDAEIPATYRAAWSTRDVEAGKAFREKLQELATNPENDPTLPRTHIDPQTGEHVVTILDPINGNIHELVRTNDAEEAGKVFSMASGFERIHLLQSFAMEQRIRDNAAKNGIEGINFKYNFSNQLGTANKLSGFESLPDDVKNRILTAELPYGSDAVKAMVEGWQTTTPISEDLRSDISKYVTQITNAKGTPDINLHESLDAWTARLLQSGQISADQFKDWVIATEAAVSARSGSPVEFMPNKVDPTDREVIEAVTKAGMHLFGGHTADFASYPPDLQGYFMSMASYFRDVQEIGQHVKQAVDAGEIPKDFSEYLANALGLPAETRLAPKSDQTLVDTVNPPLEAAGQPTFSIRAGEPNAEPKPEKDSIYHPDESTESGSDAPSTPLEDLDPSKQTGEEWQKIPWSPETSFSIKSLPTAYPEMSKEIYDQIAKDTEHVYGMWIDRMRVGDYKGIPLQGGMFYPTIKENLEKGIVWAYNAEGVANGELNKASTTGGYMKLMLMQEGNVIGNKTFAHCWFHDLQENIDAGKLTKKQALAELNRIRELFAEHANSKIRTDHTTPWKTLEQAKKDIVDMPQQKRGSTYFQKSKTVTKSEGEKIAYQSLLSQKMTKAGFPDAVQMVRDIEEPSFKGLPVGAISGIIKLHPDQTPMTAEEAGVPAHLSYGYVLKGEPVARMTNFRNVKDLFPEIPDYPLNWSTTPLDVERGLAGTFSIRSAEDRQKFQDEIDKRIHSDPEVYIPIWEKMREKVKQVQDTIDAFSRADSRDVTGTLEEKYREQGLIEINAVINALPKEIRSEFIRNWRNPYSGEQGNIFTKYSSLTTDAERTDMLVKTVRKAKEALDDALVNDFSTRHQKLLDKSAPKMKAGEKPKGKLGADTHAILADIQRYSHMDLAEVDSHVQSLQAEKDKLENGEGTMDEDARQAKIDKLDTQIWLANTHGGMSMTDADGKLKTAELRRSDVDRMGAAVEELKDIIQNGRFEFNAEKKARSDQNKAIRQQVMDIVNGGKKGTPTSVQSARDKDASGKATPSKRTDNLLLPTQLFRQILKNSPLGDEWVQRLNKAQNDEADANIKFQHDAIQTLREKWGKNGKPASTLEVQKIISELSTTLKKTGIKIRPNNVYKVRTIDRGELDNYKGLITDREYNNLMRVLSDPDNSKIKRIDIHELTEESPEEELLLSPLQFVDALTAAEQPDSIQKVERNGLTPDVVAKIRDLVMKSKAKDVYDLAKKAYDNYDRINAVFRRLYGVDLPRVENYAPLTFDTSEPEKIIDMDDGQAGGASSQPSWTKSRGNFGGILRYDNAWAKLQNHMMNVNYWVSHAETLRDFRAIFGDTQVLRSIGSQNANHSDFLKNYMKVLSRDKQTTQNMSNQDMHLKKMFASVMSVATLGGSIPTAAKHINVGLAPLSEISPTQYILSALRVGTGLAPRNAFFGGNAMIKDKVVSRFADAAHSETGADALQAAREWSSPFMQGAALTGQQIAKMSMVPLHATVNVSAAWSGAVRYDAAFTEAQGLGMSDAEAHSYAQQQVDQMLHERMNPTFRGDKPISSWGKVGPDWMQLYAGPAQQALASVINLYRGAKIDSEGKSALEAVGIKADRYGKILATWAASGAVEWLVKTAYTMICGSDQQKEEAENWKELVASLATGPIYGVPIIGPFASGSLKAAITGHNPFYAAGNPLSDMARGGYHIYQHMKNDEMTGKDYADMVKDVSIVAAWALSYAFQKDLLAKGLSGVAAWSNTGKAAAGAVQNANE